MIKHKNDIFPSQLYKTNVSGEVDHLISEFCHPAKMIASSIQRIIESICPELISLRPKMFFLPIYHVALISYILGLEHNLYQSIPPSILLSIYSLQLSVCVFTAPLCIIPSTSSASGGGGPLSFSLQSSIDSPL